jgi:shikimate kinase
VKQLLQDKIILAETFIFPANSINIIRLIPQVSYYFWAYAQLQHKLNTSSYDLINICVPSGNLGNITSGIIAYLMGLPVNKFIVATNINNAFGEYLETGITSNKKAIPSLSCAMDISIPNNLIRLKYIFQNDHIDMQHKLCSYSITDEETLNTTSVIYKKYNYLFDPHTSVGYTAIQKHQCHHKHIPTYKTILLSTAHPSKFPNVLKKLQITIPIPYQLEHLLTKQTNKILIDKDYSLWRNRIGKNITLIGMPCSGKTTQGTKLASMMNKLFIDTDTIIEQNEHKTLSNIIESGNEYFLDIEKQTILNLKCSNTVISTGGSVIYSEEAMKHLQQISTIIYLDVSLDILYKRLTNLTERGVVLKKQQTIEDLYIERSLLYNKYSHIVLTDTSIHNIVHTYLQYIQLN